MRTVAAAILAAVALSGAAACGADDETSEAASSAVASASAAAGSALSAVSSAAASALSEASSVAASVASEVTASPSPAGTAATSAAPPTGARAADNTVRVEVEGKGPKVYTPQNCSTVQGIEGFGFAGQADGGGQLVITGLGGGKGSITILGGEVGAGNAEISDLVVSDDGTFAGSATFIDTPVKFFGHCDALKK